MDAKHTPGPWCVDEVKSLGAYGVWTEAATHPGHDGTGYPSQICSVITDCFTLVGDNREERNANARLIAAAPDLLATCELLDEFQRSYDANTSGDKMPGNEHYSGLLMAIVGSARAAIAKATGG